MLLAHWDAIEKERKLAEIRTGHSTRTKQQLTAREKKIWELIQRGSRGPEYCRELHNAKLKPPKSWIDGGCPGTYPGAYLEGKPWRHRIQDEKSKIQAKAKLAKLADE